MRYRTQLMDQKVGRETQYHLYEYGYPPANPVHTETTSYDSGEYVKGNTTREMWDVVTPNFHKLVAAGMIINNPMTSIHRTYWNKPYTTFVVGRGNYKAPDGKWYEEKSLFEGTGMTTSLLGEAPSCFLAVPEYPREDLLALATNKAYSRVSLDEAYALVGLAEGDKTIMSLVQIYRKVIKIAKAIHDRDIRYLKRVISLKELKQWYMEARYALRPLAYDLSGYVTALKYEASTISDRLTFRGGETYHDQVFSESSFNAGPYHVDGTRTRYMEFRTVLGVDVRTGVLTKLTNLSSLPAWGLTELAESAWELTPMSFVWDWFLNVGNTISAWTPNFGLETLASWAVITTTVVRTAKITGSSATFPSQTSTFIPLENTYLIGEGEVGETVITRERIPNPARAIIPRKSVRLNMLKLIDLVIILKQLVG